MRWDTLKEDVAIRRPGLCIILYRKLGIAGLAQIVPVQRKTVPAGYLKLPENW